MNSKDNEDSDIENVCTLFCTFSYLFI